MGVVSCGRAGTWEDLNTRRCLERHLMGEKTSELLSGSLSFYLPRAQGSILQMRKIASKFPKPWSYLWSVCL